MRSTAGFALNSLYKYVFQVQSTQFQKKIITNRSNILWFLHANFEIFDIFWRLQLLYFFKRHRRRRQTCARRRSAARSGPTRSAAAAAVPRRRRRAFPTADALARAHPLLTAAASKEFGPRLLRHRTPSMGYEKGNNQIINNV